MSHYTLKKADYTTLDKNTKVAIITAQFNLNYTQQLEDVNVDFLKNEGFENIDTYQVPGAYEIPGLAKQILEKNKADLIICLGVVIKWDTPHFDYVCDHSASWIMSLVTSYNTPIMNGILTCLNEQQVVERIKPVYSLSGLNTLVAYNQV